MAGGSGHDISLSVVSVLWLLGVHDNHQGNITIVKIVNQLCISLCTNHFFVPYSCRFFLPSLPPKFNQNFVLYKILCTFHILC